MALYLICFLSSEEKFVKIINDFDCTSPLNAIRRLSLQKGRESQVMAQATWILQHTRSITGLRVLDLEGYNLSRDNSSLKYLGNLHHLRYLGLCETGISQLPEEIENLLLLQTLDVSSTKFSACLQV
jgi:Leucine-rich repeat (LRR) protein